MQWALEIETKFIGSEPMKNTRKRAPAEGKKEKNKKKEKQAS
jgi:hypothetical protein